MFSTLFIGCLLAITVTQTIAEESIPQSVVSYVGRMQSVGIRGRLLCGSEPLVGTKVKLWEEDAGPDTDDLMAESSTNATGHFELSGTQTEISNIEPKFKIYHSCNARGPCKRKVTFTLPDSYINKGNKVDKWFEFGSLNMEIIQRKEGTQCF